MNSELHRISQLEIANFRSCTRVSLPLKSFTPLVGQNNAGKSTILRALMWILQPTNLSAEEFSNTKEQIVVAAKIEGISDALLSRVPDEKHQKAIKPYLKHGVLWIRAVAEPGKKPVREVWDIDAYVGAAMPEIWRSYPTGLPDAVSVLLPEALYIPAMDDLAEDLGKAKAGTTMRDLLDEVMRPVLKAHKELADAHNTLKTVLGAKGANRSPHVTAFDSGASAALSEFFPGLSLELDIQIAELKDLVKSGDLLVSDLVTLDSRRFDQLGTGAQRAIQMALVRYLSEVRIESPDSASRRVLILDEPELYLHPQGVKRVRDALEKLARTGFQVVFSTHSPLMLNRENAANTVIVEKSAENGTKPKRPLKQAVENAISGAEAQSRTIFELGRLAEVYFSDRVVLCEGKTDQRVLELAYERVFGHAPDVDGIAFIALGACSDINKALPVLAAMDVKAFAVADLDYAFTHARTGANALLNKTDPNFASALAVLSRLKSDGTVELAPNGLPLSSKTGGPSAEASWGAFAADSEGLKIARVAHESLKAKRVWVWPIGSIEQATGADAKGEDAIIAQEVELQAMDEGAMRSQMPHICECLDWLRN